MLNQAIQKEQTPFHKGTNDIDSCKKQMLYHWICYFELLASMSSNPIELKKKPEISHQIQET